MKTSTEGLSHEDLTRLRSAIDEAAIVAITDKKGVITYVNNKFCAISQYSREELIGQTHRIINSGFHPHEFFVEMWKTIASGRTWEGEIRNRAKNGTFYWVHTTIVPFTDASGRPEHYVSVRFDITERKMAEEQLKVYSKRLEVSNQELQDFASVAAHDLQEPLRKIQSFADRLKVKAKEDLAPEPLDYLERILSSARRMQTLINDLLSYSRVTTRAQPFVAVDLDRLVIQVLSDLEIAVEKTQAEIRVGHLPVIEADPTQMTQLFQNLIANALKFVKPGDRPQIEMDGRILGESVEIVVRDHGIGFDPKYLDRIFTIFQRLHGRHEYEGTGIGLAICRKIVDRHGGLITARSEIDKGSEFVITLPARRQLGTQL